MFTTKNKVFACENFRACNAMVCGVGLILCSLLFLCSCIPQHQSIQQPISANPTPCSSCKEAKQFDALVPLGFTGKTTTKFGSLLTVQYEGIQPVDRVTAFYKREMEAAGWDLSNFSNDKEGLFFCRKGIQECAISVRPKGKTTITFLYKMKALTVNATEVDLNRINKPFNG